MFTSSALRAVVSRIGRSLMRQSIDSSGLCTSSLLLQAYSILLHTYLHTDKSDRITEVDDGQSFESSSLSLTTWLREAPQVYMSYRCQCLRLFIQVPEVVDNCEGR